MTATHYEAQDIVLEIVAHFLTFALVCTHAGAREASTAFKLDPWSAARNAAAVVEQEPRGGRAPSECVVVVHGRVRVKKEIYGYRCVVLSWARLTALLFHLPVLLFRRSALPAALLACVYTHLSACLIARLFTSLHARLSECLALPAHSPLYRCAERSVHRILKSSTCRTCLCRRSSTKPSACGFRSHWSSATVMIPQKESMENNRWCVRERVQGLP
jgi:hypothetical protein